MAVKVQVAVPEAIAALLMVKNWPDGSTAEISVLVGIGVLPEVETVWPTKIPAVLETRTWVPALRTVPERVKVVAAAIRHQALPICFWPVGLVGVAEPAVAEM